MRQSIISINAWFVLIRAMWMNLIEIWIEVKQLSYKKMNLKRRLQNDVHTVSVTMSNLRYIFPDDMHIIQLCEADFSATILPLLCYQIVWYQNDISIAETSTNIYIFAEIKKTSWNHFSMAYANFRYVVNIQKHISYYPCHSRFLRISTFHWNT